jgi:hypothetical protein
MVLRREGPNILLRQILCRWGVANSKRMAKASLDRSLQGCIKSGPHSPGLVCLFFGTFCITALSISLMTFRGLVDFAARSFNRKP